MDQASTDLRPLLVDLLPRLRRFAYSLTGARDTADDLTQAAILKALDKSGAYAAGTRFDSWMFMLMKNLWIDQLRAKAVRGPVVDPDDYVHIPGTDGRDETETRLMAAKARQAMQTLPPEQRAVVSLVLVEGYAYREAAEILEVPLGTVMSRLARARQAIIAFMQGNGAGQKAVLS
jgi:RNA polymerase sigma-70 factor (ECF subfamily)